LPRFVPPRALPPFPTRRSSDLFVADLGGQIVACPDVVRRRSRDAFGGRFRGLLRALRKRSRHEADAFDPETRADLVRLVRQLKRSEEHTSELQSLAYLVCRLLL